MGVRRWWATAAVERSHVLVVAPHGCFPTRVALEEAISRRGWALALSPADADVLALCRPAGSSLHEVVEAAAEHLWSSMGSPRARIEISHQAEIEGALDGARDALLDAAAEAAVPSNREEKADHGHTDHGDMDHGDTDMAPHGIPLAEGSEEDRDGLEMDELHVPLGPVLPHWPASLVLHATLHGDVLAAVTVEVLDVVQTTGARLSTAETAARRCDAVLDVLALAGWEAGAGLARRARAEFLAGDGDAAVHRIEALRGRVERHVLLGWMLRGVGAVSAEDLRCVVGDTEMHALVGDVRDRVLGLLDAAITGPGRGPALTAKQVGDLVTRATCGLDLATARLVVASFDVVSLLEVREEVVGV